MPNHITTRIKITGDPEAVKRVLNKILNFMHPLPQQFFSDYSIVPRKNKKSRSENPNCQKTICLKISEGRKEECYVF